MAAGKFRIPRRFHRWNPNYSVTDAGIDRVEVTHPKNKQARGIASHPYLPVAMHAAQMQAIEVYEARKIEDAAAAAAEKARSKAMKPAASIRPGKD